MALPASVRADVAVIVNRTDEIVRFQVFGGVKPRAYEVKPGDVATLPMREKLRLECPSAEPEQYALAANSAYFFQRDGERLTLNRLDLRDDALSAEGRALGETAGDRPELTIPVKILVDEEERGSQAAWEQRLRARVAAASEIFSRLFDLRFDVVAVESWRSDDRIRDFVQSMREFEEEVDPAPARLAIGFTGQYAVHEGKVHLGGTRLPLHTHVLIREWSPRVSEPERLEVLVHELGHVFGAAHSPEAGSVMRPVLGDDRSLAAGFPITFDPVNALCVYLLVEELRCRQVESLAAVSAGTKHRLRQLYGVIAETHPEDPVAAILLRVLQPGGLASQAQRLPLTPIDPNGELWQRRAAGAREVLQAIVAAAAANQGEARPTGDRVRPPASLAGDAITEYYVRQAAGAARRLDPEIARHALLLALGIGMDRTEVLLGNPIFRGLALRIESADERARRVRVLGTPTMRSRADLAQHFFACVFLTATLGSQLAETAGIAKEVVDAKGGSGFSFADLAADYAGIAFAERILAGQLEFATLEAFTVQASLPEVDDLPESLGWAEFEQRYGSLTDGRFLAERKKILDRLQP